MNQISKKQGIKRIAYRFMTVGLTNLFMFLLVLYMLFAVGKSIWVNYQSNKVISSQSKQLDQLEEEIKAMKNEVEYLKTNSYREKEARAKLGYKAPGENVISLPLDMPQDKIADSSQGSIDIKTPNYRLWWEFFSK